MSVSVYNVDRKHIFNELVAIDVTSSICLYCQSDENKDGVGIESTSPEFLARFRKVKYDGSISGIRYLNSVSIPVGCKILIKKNGDVGILFPNRKYYEFDKRHPEDLVLSELDEDEFGPFGSSHSLTMTNFYKYMDTWRIERPKKPSPSRRNYISDSDIIDDYDEDLLQEL